MLEKFKVNSEFWSSYLTVTNYNPFQDPTNIFWLFSGVPWVWFAGEENPDQGVNKGVMGKMKSKWFRLSSIFTCGDS